MVDASQVMSIASTGYFGGVGTAPKKARTLKDVNSMANMIGVVYAIFKHYFVNLAYGRIPPAAIMGGIPLPHVEELSGTVSNLMLKYRATGGVFLAHQKGGEESLRIQGKAWGPNRFIFLDMLSFLFIYGSATTLDYFKNVNEDLFPYIEDEPSKNPWLEFHRNSPDEGLEEAHKTFPVITKNRIYYSMYIETFTYEEKIELGQVCVNYTIFFRNFDAFRKHKFGYMSHPKTGNPIAYYKIEEEKGRLPNMLEALKPLITSWLFATFVVPAEYNPISIGSMFATAFVNEGTPFIDMDKLKKTFFTNSKIAGEYFF